MQDDSGGDEVEHHLVDFDHGFVASTGFFVVKDVEDEESEDRIENESDVFHQTEDEGGDDVLSFKQEEAAIEDDAEHEDVD